LHGHEYEPQAVRRLFPETAMQLAKQTITRISEITEDKTKYDPREKSIRNHQRALRSPPIPTIASYADLETTGLDTPTTTTIRFISRDPIRYRGSKWNLYEYVAGKPTKYLDPSGLRLFSCCNGKTYEPAGQGCCNKAIYSLATDCCENGVVVAKVEIQICRRRLNGDVSSIPFFGWLSYTFIVCPDGKMFGKHPKPFEDPGSTGKASGYVNEEDNDLSKAVCNPKKICPSEAKRMCKAGPTNVPYDLLCTRGYGTNCYSWGNSNSW